MGEEFSMGSALDLAGRQRELADSVNQAVEQSHGTMQQARGASADSKKAAWIRAQSAKIDAARAAADVRQAGAERNFAVLKSVMNLGMKVFGQKMAQMSDKKSDTDRARDAVENGAAATRRLSSGGEHDQKIGALLDFEKQKTAIDTQRNGVQAELNQLMQDHDGGKVWTAADQQLAKNLRQEDMNLQRQGELLAGIAQAQAAGAFSNTQLVGGGWRSDNTNDQAQASASDFLQKQGFDSRQMEMMKEYSRMQAEANTLRGERANLRQQGQESDLDKQSDVMMDKLQTQLNTMLQDQEAVRRFEPAAKFVEAQDAYDKIKNDPGADPVKVASAHRKMEVAGDEFASSRNVPLNQKPSFEMWSTVLGDTFLMLDQLRQLNKQYAQAQAQLSAASEQAGNAMEQAKDMELS